MPKRIPPNDLDAILTVVGDRSSGIRLEELLNILPSTSSRRTLQRRLALLVARNQLLKTGRGRGTQYQMPKMFGANQKHSEISSQNYRLHAEPATYSIQGHDATLEVYIPVSEEGQSIKKAIRKPIEERTPVGFNRGFLDSYRPNETYYLPLDLRDRLMSLGKSVGTPQPAGTFARQMLNRLLIDLSWNSSRLEGNTYSLLETERLIQLGASAEGKDAREAQMILNHKRAIELLVDQAGEIGFNPYTIRSLHALLSDNLLADPEACGKLRRRPVGIGGTVYHPLEVPQLIEECFQQILDTASAIRDPFEQAFFAMVQLPYLQPFEDVNKRVSRLAANIPLIRTNLCPLSFVQVRERVYVDGILGVYELNRVELLRDVFAWAYERSCARYSAVYRSLGDPDPFRLRYREIIKETVSGIVRARMDKRSAVEEIRRSSVANLPREEQSRFIEVVETELMSLHEGNIARFRLRPQEFQAWHETWY